MSTILAIAPFYPMFDRAAGDFRLYTLLKILAGKHDVTFHPYHLERQRQLYGATEMQRYGERLSALGIKLWDREWYRIIKSQSFDVVLFEFYYAAQMHLRNIRIWQPGAHTVIDTVDVHFKRLFSKAHITGEVADLRAANEMKDAELAIYRNADLVVAVTASDREALLNEAPNLDVRIIPTIHSAPDCVSKGEARKDLHSLIFVGNFNHEPNVDGILYFCREILPSIRKAVSDVRLKIVGNEPPEAVRSLACEFIEVTGYVPDLTPYLLSSVASIAPLRFGAGMNGKIGEAMSYGLPVVTTSVGMEGFRLTPGENVLVADTPDEFSTAVIRLIQDRELSQHISANGRKFIEETFSEAAVAEDVYDCFDHLKTCSVKKLPQHEFLKIRVSDYLDRHLLWRFKH